MDSYKAEETALTETATKLKADAAALAKEAEEVLTKAILSPFKIILENAGIKAKLPTKKGVGINVITGEEVNMQESGIIDPLLVTKSALVNAASVATTILSTDCVINNLRIDESNRK